MRFDTPIRRRLKHVLLSLRLSGIIHISGISECILIYRVHYFWVTQLMVNNSWYLWFHLHILALIDSYSWPPYACPTLISSALTRRCARTQDTSQMNNSTNLEYRDTLSCGISEVQIIENDFTTNLTIWKVAIIWLKLRLTMKYLQYCLRRSRGLLCIRCEGGRVSQIRSRKCNNIEWPAGNKEMLNKKSPNDISTEYQIRTYTTCQISSFQMVNHTPIKLLHS